MSELRQQIRHLVENQKDQFIAIRRHLHENPELSFEEYNTCTYISGVLDEWGIENKKVADTGIVAIIKGSNPETKTIALRGDIDGLPITENTNLSFSSKNKGVMHACGHDIHTTCILGAAFILNNLKSEFEGTVKIIFQPGEEKLPGGATKIIASGELDNPKIDVIVGQHVYPEMEVGKLGFRPGKYMASSDEIYIDVNGPGGHGAMPEKTVDSLNISSRLILSLQEIVEVSTNSIPTVLTFGKIEGEGATNVIPKLVHIEGTLRTMEESWRQELHEEMKRRVKDLEERSGAKIDLEIRKGYPCLINDEETTLTSKSLAQDFLGAENVDDLDIRMTSEDFSFYSQNYKSCFYRLGVRTPGAAVTNLHTPEFLVDEKALETGIGFMSFFALNFLKKRD